MDIDETLIQCVCMALRSQHS